MTRTGTSRRFLLDTSAWIELFEGSERGRRVREIIKKNGGHLLVSDASFAELYGWAARTGRDPGDAIRFMRGLSQVIEIYTNYWVEAEDLKLRVRPKHPDIGIIDALLLAIARHTKATIVTTDAHFKGMKGVMLL